MILNGKENKKASAICFEIRIPKKKKKVLLWKISSKNYGNYFIMEKKHFWFVNNYDYHYREMGLMTENLYDILDILAWWLNDKYPFCRTASYAPDIY